MSQQTTVYGNTNFSITSKKVVTQQTQEIAGLAYPFGSKKNIGGFFSKDTSISLIKGAVKQLLGTTKGERVMHPSYGVDLQRYLFQPLDEDTFEQIKDEILNAFNRYVVGGRIVRLVVEPADSVTVAGGNGLRVAMVIKLDRDALKVFDVEVTVS